MQRFPIHRIRLRHTYTLNEVSELLVVHKNTVRMWLKSGLRAIDDSRPILIFGADLKAYLSQKQAAKKTSCKPHEFFCLKCRAARKPWGEIVDITIRRPNLFNIHAICEVCDTAMNKAAGIKSLSQLHQAYRVQQIHPRHIVETLPPSVRCYLQDKEKNQ